MGKNNLTIKDIAKKTGFSVRTVSRVINNGQYVKEETRKIIDDVINETGFETNIFAKSLRKKTVKNIILVIEKQQDLYPGQWYSNMFQNIINQASTYEYNVFMLQFNMDDEEENKKNIQLLKSGFVDGAIILNIRKDDDKIKLFQELSIPYVTIGKNYNYPDNPFVEIDNYKAAYLVADYLIKSGCRSILFFLGSDKYISNEERREGFFAAVKDNNMEKEAFVIYEGIKSHKDAYGACYTMIEKNQLPDAIFVSGDEKALGVLKALNEKGIAIPKAIQVVGFDNIPISEFTVPSLTTVEQNANDLAAKAIEILIGRINEETHDKGELKIIFDPKLIRRHTTRDIEGNGY